MLNRLSDLHWSRTTRVVDDTVVQIAIGDVVTYGSNGTFDVG